LQFVRDRLHLRLQDLAALPSFVVRSQEGRHFGNSLLQGVRARRQEHTQEGVFHRGDELRDLLLKANNRAVQLLLQLRDGLDIGVCWIAQEASDQAAERADQLACMLKSLGRLFLLIQRFEKVRALLERLAGLLQPLEPLARLLVGIR